MSRFHLQCTECAKTYGEREAELVCPRCAAHQEPGGVTRGVLEVVLDELPERWPDAAPGSREFLAAFLPMGPPETVPPLPVGQTPLLDVANLRHALGTPHLWVKDDTRNPSGSTKDRASHLVVAKALEYGYKTIACASTGNAATALAAVAAAAGVEAVVFVPASAPEAKLVQMLAYGARLLPVEGTYDQAFELSASACERFGWYNRNTAYNPYTIEGKKTAALEIAAQIAPQEVDAVLVPTGDGVIVSGVAKGFADLERCGLIRRCPRLVAVQPEGSAAIAEALSSGAETITPLKRATSVADSLNVKTPRNALLALRRIRASGGGAVIVSDDAIVAAIAELARSTGVFAEPAGAAALAGLHAALAEGLVDRDERIVLLVTGNGLKDVPAAARAIERPQPIPPTLDAVTEIE